MAAPHEAPSSTEILLTRASPRAAVRRWPGPRPLPESWSSPRRQLVAVGLVAVLVHLAIAATALAGLGAVRQAHEDAARIVAAQRHFQDADMAHDAILASAKGALLERAALLPREDGAQPVRQLRSDVAGFRAQLRRVDSVELPSDLEARLQEVRGLQDSYADEAETVAEAVDGDPAVLGARVQGLRLVHHALTEDQRVLTEAMGAEADRRQQAAAAHERRVQRRLVAAVAAALLGLLGVTALLHRMGGALAELLARERGVAETLQRSLLPDRLPDVPGVRLAARYSAGGVGTQVGGDWYDVIPLLSGRVGLVMGDVVGHDLHAASNMGQLRNALRACAAEGTAPEDVLHRLNRLCIVQGLGDMATLLYAVLDPVTGVVDIASAGHYPPLLVTREGRCFLESAPCAPVGVARETAYRSTKHVLPAGSLLLLYTDGLVERRASTVDEGLARLEQLVDLRPDGDLERLCDEVLTGMLEGRTPEDDVALLLVAPQSQLGPHVDVVWPAQAERLPPLRDLLERWLTEAGSTDDERYDILVACSEAASNAVEHAYGPGLADFRVVCDLRDRLVTITVRDWGQWRPARGQDRGRGLGLMEQLMDDVVVRHGDRGTEVRLCRRLDAAVARPTEVRGVPRR